MSKLEPNIECRFFIGGGSAYAEESDTVTLVIDDGYEALPAKVLEFFRNCLKTSDFEWLFKCEDDTYLVLDRLNALVPSCEALVGNHFLDQRGSPSGGAGYLLPRSIVQKLAYDFTLPSYGPEDIIVGEAAVRHGAATVTSGFLGWNANHQPRQENHMITAHGVSPDQMRVIHTMMIEHPLMEFEASHSGWKDRLVFFKNGYFSRRSTPCCGRWVQNESTLRLEWFQWDPEELSRENSGFRSEKMRLVPVILSPARREQKTPLPSPTESR